MVLSPLARQFLVAGSTYLAALSVGGVIAYPSVLLQQFKSNDTIIQIDLNKGSWIGSVHGIAGIPSILLPLLMQCRGRKFAFILSCVLIITGWMLTYIAQNVTTLIIGECFHGLGTNSLLAVSFLSISEVVRPKYRNTCLLLYSTVQAFGISSVGILGKYLHWKTVSLIMTCPVLLALPIGFSWPESPSWLACKGKFVECERTFEKLRGTDEESKKELKALVNAQKQKLKAKSVSTVKDLRNTITSRYFYLPMIHTFMLINVLYWAGGMPVIIYSSDMILKISNRVNEQAKLAMDILLFIGFNITTVLVRFCSSKKVMLFSMSASAVCMTAASLATYLQQLGTMSKDSELGVYFLVAYVAFLSLGASSVGFTISSELMPVKHRGIGGCWYVIYTCIFHSSSLKAYPYLSVYINIWGVFLLYAIYGALSILFIWKYVPETRNKTLQEIEEYYVHGSFKEADKDDAVDVPFIKADIK